VTFERLGLERADASPVPHAAIKSPSPARGGGQGGGS
jgi:hypothetical protein